MNKTKELLLADVANMSDEQIILLGQNLIAEKLTVDVMLGRGEQKFTLLQASCFYVKGKAIEWLTQNGANPNTKTKNGNNSLSLLMANFYTDKENKSDGFWKNYRNALNALFVASADCNLPTYDNKKPVFILLKYEKNQIPEDILIELFKRTDFNDSIVKKNGDDIFASLIFNTKNFTFKNVEFLIKEKNLSLNNTKEPHNSIVFLMSFSSPTEMKQLRKPLIDLHKVYPFDFNIKRKVFNKSEMITALDNAISEKNISAFKFILANSQLAYNTAYGDLGLVGQCAIMDFIPGLSYALKNYPFNWDLKDELLNVCDSSNGRFMIDSEYKKFLFNSLSSKLKNKEEVKKEKRMKI